ncbi:MAG TPA: (2Fe-2S)-binding protein [Chloroflexota bacterium]|nr:(2Fe-2S)-binding protein [Chloroflexota bacterium]
MSATHEVALSVNGRAYQRRVEPRLSLADFLRDDLGLTGTHVGCEHGVCGACTILLDGHPVRSCLLFAVQADGCTLTTIEGLAEMPSPPALSQGERGPRMPSPPALSQGERGPGSLPRGERGPGSLPLPLGEGRGEGALHPLQDAFRRHHALQCGFCTPGFLMTLVVFTRDHPDASDAEIREALAGNLCRCTGYQNIVEAVRDVLGHATAPAGGAAHD